MQVIDELGLQLSDAITASENIVNCLHHGDFEAAKEHDLERAAFIRTLSQYRDLDGLVHKHGEQLRKLSDLNESILEISGLLRDEVLTQITKEQTNKSGHVQYLQNQRL